MMGRWLHTDLQIGMLDVEEDAHHLHHRLHHPHHHRHHHHYHHHHLQMGMLVVEEEWERDVNGGGGIPVLRDV